MGIQQKLHTKLVQKLILTPSLQQAIKLLPMSTLELSDLLNQEMVENPMLEEVPTEELQPADTAAAPEKNDAAEKANKTDTWDDQDYEYFFGDYLDDGYRPRPPQEVKKLPPTKTPCQRPARSVTICCGSSPCKPTIRSCARSVRRSSATWTTMGIWWPRSTSWLPWGPGQSAMASVRCGRH